MAGGASSRSIAPHEARRLARSSPAQDSPSPNAPLAVPDKSLSDGVCDEEGKTASLCGSRTRLGSLSSSSSSTYLPRVALARGARELRPRKYAQQRPPLASQPACSGTISDAWRSPPNQIQRAIIVAVVALRVHEVRVAALGEHLGESCGGSGSGPTSKAAGGGAWRSSRALAAFGDCCPSRPDAPPSTPTALPLPSPQSRHSLEDSQCIRASLLSPQPLLAISDGQERPS